MDSDKINEIRAFILTRRVKAISALRIRPTDGVILATIPSDAIGQKVTRETTSQRQLEHLRKAIAEEFGLGTQFLITRGTDQDALEVGLKALLGQRFTDQVGDCFLSLPGPTDAEVWVELFEREETSKSIRPEVEKVAREFVELARKSLRQIYWITNMNPLPSAALILRAVKICQPADLQRIEEYLSAAKLSLPSLSWLQNKLDALRKRGIVIRQKDGTYVTTSIALSVVPHGPFRSSSDLERALALGRKKWR